MKNLIHDFLFPDTKVSIKNDFIWNTIAGLLNAIEAVVLLSVVTRICGVEEAGYLSIAFAVANLFVAIGKYGVRHFQVTNSENEITLESYRNMRIISIIIMLVCCTIYTISGRINNGYSWHKVFIVMIMCIIYAIEAMEDSYWGYLHRNNKLASGAKIFILRWGSILVIMSFGLLLGGNLLETLFVSLIISWIIYLICIRQVRNEYNYHKGIWDWGQIKIIFYKCTPLALAVFFNYYICNGPKYTIDAFMDDEMQAYYGYIAMPVFAIQLLSNFIFQPLLVRISNSWKENNFKKFRKFLLKQYFVIFILVLICLIGTYLLGIQLLTIIYGIDLFEYKMELMVLMLGGGLLALDGFLNIILTIMDARKKILFGYSLSALIVLIILPKLVLRFGVMGAAMGYCGIMFILAVYFNLNVWRIFWLRSHQFK